MRKVTYKRGNGLAVTGIKGRTNRRTQRAEGHYWKDTTSKMTQQAGHSRQDTSGIRKQQAGHNRQDTSGIKKQQAGHSRQDTSGIRKQQAGHNRQKDTMDWTDVQRYYLGFIVTKSHSV
ncbi:hypothetical protein Pmani_013331 [Petrolisthes manimaculis]|uniref:Uncharacterized protein n=1 Tax=Petrolisthes manimaculis TaxID=1843537 RepID=A0AAE1PW32_9EUCA|nr:hypothetical protein Pmani_013331 [Petrolisthes manimaculis]